MTVHNKPTTAGITTQRASALTGIPLRVRVS